MRNNTETKEQIWLLFKKLNIIGQWSGDVYRIMQKFERTKIYRNAYDSKTSK